LKDCKEIEELLWQYALLDNAEKARVDSHLTACHNCAAALKTISELKLSSARDQNTLGDIDSRSFDSKVWQKIAEQKSPLISPESSAQPRYGFRMAFSFALAAVVVLFVVKSISDLSEMGIVKKPLEQAQVNGADNVGRINIELAPRKIEPPTKSEAPLNMTLAESPKSKQAQKEAKPAHTMASLKASDQKQEQVFSILPSPIVSPSPDSVNIGAVYVTNENIPLLSQSRAASLAEVFTDTGAVQTIMPHSNILVTVEKMPKPIKIAIPDYPVWARKQNLSGTVWVRAKVGVDGKVTEASIISCDLKGVGFEEEALKAARDNFFTPASANGIEIAVWVVYPVRFISKD